MWPEGGQPWGLLRPAVEKVQRHFLALWSDFEDGAAARQKEAGVASRAGSTKFGCPIEIPICCLNESGSWQLTVGANSKIVQDRQPTTRSDSKDGATAEAHAVGRAVVKDVAAFARGSIQIAVFPLD